MVGGGWQWLAVGGWRLAVGCRWRLAAVGDCRLAIGGWWSLGVVLNKKGIWFPKDPPGFPGSLPSGCQHQK